MSTSTTERYVISAAAQDAWHCRLQVPLEPYDTVCRALEIAARLRDMPITAVVQGSAGDVTDLWLLRDPSRSFGTPSVARCDELAEMLVGATGWRRRPTEPLPGIVIPLGLRRGYALDAPVHPARAIRRRLVDDVPGTQAWPVRLCSVRPLDDGEPQWWHEPGLLVHTEAERLPGIARIAAELGQDRFVATGGGATTAYRLQDPAGS